MMQRRDLLKAGLLGLVGWAGANASGDERPGTGAADAGAADFPLAEATIAQLQAAMAAGSLSATTLAQAYVARISALDQSGPRLRSVIELNPDVEVVAAALDQERRHTGARGPLHGIPILIKDNLETRDRMSTSAGSLALVGATPVADAVVVQRLRAAGALILGKTNLSEWANFRSTQSISGWSGRGGFTRNPYALDRTPSGSSSGSAAAVAASLCAVALGTETDGSVTAPSSSQAIVGLKPTVGLVSRTGIVPISASQDTAGPMARTVTDVALLLNGMVGPADPEDPATSVAGRALAPDYASGLTADGLRGARLGVVRELAGEGGHDLALFAAALDDLRRLGAELVEVKLPSGPAIDEAELEVLLYEFKAGINAYLPRRRPGAEMRSLADLIAFNRQQAAVELRWFGQDLFERAQAKGPLSSPAYLRARAHCLRQLRTEGIDAALRHHHLDALVTVTTAPAALVDRLYGDRPLPSGTSPAAIAGYPSLSVPMGEVQGLPVGVLFFGRAWDEARLLRLGFAYEQATHRRRPPTYPSTLDLQGG